MQPDGVSLDHRLSRFYPSVIFVERMIISASIVICILAGWVSYRVLFYDSDDFWEGCGKFTGGLLRSRRRWIWQKSEPPPPPEFFEDESWSSGIRFFLFLAVSFGSGYFTYYQLQKYLG